MQNIEVCDRCNIKLDKLKNEDIYLEKLNIVVCNECHNDLDIRYWGCNK